MSGVGGPMTANEHLRQARIKSCVPLWAVAEALHVDVSYVSEVERGELRVPPDLLLKWAEVVGHSDPMAVVAAYNSAEQPRYGA